MAEIDLSFIDRYQEGELSMDELKKMATEIILEMSKDWQSDVEDYVASKEQDDY